MINLVEFGRGLLGKLSMSFSSETFCGCNNNGYLNCTSSVSEKLMIEDA